MNDHYENSFQFFEKKPRKTAQKHAELYLAAYELHTPENMGAIIRLAANLNVKKVFFIHKEAEINKTKLAKVAHSSMGKVEYEILKEEDFWQQTDSIPVIALETTSKSKNLFKYSLPQKVIILCGSERFGLPNSTINRCKESFFIPIPGITRSLNVSHAITIAAFEWAKQHLPEQMSIE